MPEQELYWEGCRIPRGAIDPDEIESLADLDEAIAAFDAAEQQQGDHFCNEPIYVSEWEACEW